MKGKLANGVGSQYSHATSERGISGITDAPTDLNGLVRFGERRNLVSARVPSRSARAIPRTYLHPDCTNCIPPAVQTQRYPYFHLITSIKPTEFSTVKLHFPLLATI